MLNKKKLKYIIITPAKNEERYIEFTLKSVCAQSLKPQQWIIVNDGSSDNTANIVKKYANKYSWIQLINNKTEQEKRVGGAKVVKIFYVGYNFIKKHNYDFIVKLDADLSIPTNYFENIANCFKEDLKIGLCGGYIVNKINGKMIKEKAANYHIRGAFKSYRKKCFEDIGGLKKVWSWDGLDQMNLMYLGWKTKVLPLKVIHHRPTSKEYKLIKHRFETGKEYYRNGYYFDLAFIKSLHFGSKKPFFLGGVGFLLGYIIAFLFREKKNVDENFAKFIRKFQYKRIINCIKKLFKYEKIK